MSICIRYAASVCGLSVHTALCLNCGLLDLRAILLIHVISVNRVCFEIFSCFVLLGLVPPFAHGTTTAKLEAMVTFLFPP